MKPAPALPLLLAVSALSARAQELPVAFEAHEWRVPGRVVDAFVAQDEAGHDTAIAISLGGSAPAERRWLTPVPEDLSTPASPVEVPPEVVAVDAAELGLAPGPELVFLSAGELRVVSLHGNTLRSQRIEPPLPLPPRTWELAHVDLVRDWDGDGRLEVLAPTSTGIRLLPLEPGDTAQDLRLPLIADYGSPTIENYFRPGLVSSVVSWPTFALADDDGDGRNDLFAIDRYRLSVFRATAAGLPSTPSRVVEFPPFSAEEERRHLASTLLGFVRDLDGDGRADLVVHRMVGELLRSRSTTTVHMNTGAGVDPLAAPSGRVERAGGSSALRVADVDGDGRSELLEAYIGFGVAQAVRMLTLQRLELRLRVLSLPSGGGDPRETWADSVTFPFDFANTRVRGVLPFVKADWNADGRLDLCWGDGSVLRFRLGEAGPHGARFGPIVASMPLRLSGDLVAADIDHDGLPDVVAFDPLDTEGRLQIGRNRGTLPGTPPSLRAPEPATR